jgi:hypothetical protein
MTHTYRVEYVDPTTEDGVLKSVDVEDVDDAVLDSDGITLIDDDGKTIAAYATGVSARRIS